MDYLKSFNVIILSFLLILTGCFGMFGDEEDDSAEAEDSTVASTLTAQDIADAMILASNSPPELTIKKFDSEMKSSDDDYDYIIQSNWKSSGYFMCIGSEDYLQLSEIGTTIEEQREALAQDLDEGESMHLANIIEADKCVIYFDFLSIDPDGDTMTKGIDTNFDGIIDIPIEPNHGLTLVVIDNSTSKQVWNGFRGTSCEMIDLAFIAIDQHGASTVEFMHFLGGGICDDDLDYGSGSNLALYTFSGADGAGADEVVMTMDGGSDLSWAFITIKVAIGQAASEICDATCYSSTDTVDTVNWNVGEAVTLVTNGCGTDVTTCKVSVTILNSRDGVTLSSFDILME